jgi:hypothetical protein
MDIIFGWYQHPNNSKLIKKHIICKLEDVHLLLHFIIFLKQYGIAILILDFIDINIFTIPIKK